jgi:hypothetical protein
MSLFDRYNFLSSSVRQKAALSIGQRGWAGPLISAVLSTRNEARITLDALDDELGICLRRNHTTLPDLVEEVKEWIRKNPQWQFVPVAAKNERETYMGRYPFHFEQSYITYRDHWYLEHLNAIGKELLPQWEEVTRPQYFVAPCNKQCAPLFAYIRAKALYYAALRRQVRENVLKRLFSVLEQRRDDCVNLGFKCFKYCYGLRCDMMLFGDEECPICLDTICPEIVDELIPAEPTHNAWVLPCGHVMHYSCASRVAQCPFRCEFFEYE